MNRNKILRFGVIAVVAVIVARLFCIQIIDHEVWAEKAAAQQTRQNVLLAKRGEIYMLDGDEPVAVAMNATVYTVIVDPMLAEQEEVEKEIGALLGDKRVAEWRDVFADKKMRYYVVARNVERKVAEKVAEADVAGVWLQANTKRVYPEGGLGATLLGFVNAEGMGQYGIEGALNDDLSGKDGLLRTVKDVNNVALSIGEDNVRIPAQDGKNVVLTIDRNLQYKVEKILTEKAGEVGFRNLSAIVMNPQNGKVLAMANIPGYDPANFGAVESAEDYINHVVEDPYEPASVCKVFAFATGLEYGVMTPDKTYQNDNVTYVDGLPIKNAVQYTNLVGTTTMQTALDWSMNTGSTQVLRWLSGSETEITAQGRERLYEYYYDKFGLGKETGVELLESIGTVQGPHAEIYGLDATYANMTFGQNMQVTMLQVAAGLASLINGGEYFTPTVVAGEMVEGKFVEKEEQAPVRRAVSAETSATMREMMYNTRKSWRENGTDPAGYYIGGKTGTAQAIKNGGYSFDETIATYVGFGGAEGGEPEYLIMVRVWENDKKAAGDAHALPVFNALKAQVQDYLKIKPGA